MSTSTLAPAPTAGDQHTPGTPSFIFGVAFPAAVIAVELISRMCATALFDPLPTWWHVLAVCSVPAGNLLIWLHLDHGTAWSTKWLAFVNGGVIAVAGFYTVLFMPLLPLAVVAIVIGIGI